jgi:proteasome lid subunit RPN8/RPN11
MVGDRPVILTGHELDAIRAQAVEEYPEECCGVILSRGAERRFFRCRNAQNQKHAEDPQAFPRDARTAYYLHDDDRFAMIRLERDGFVPAVIYHSHIDAGAYFSETDKRQASLDGEPHYPDAIYVVVSVVGGQLAAVNAFRWHPGARDFLPVDFSVGEAGARTR